MRNNFRVKHHRRSMRLKGYDYSSNGFYFITLNTQDRRHYFGRISNGVMHFDEPGRIAELFLNEVAEHFDHAWVAAHVVMPDHVHLILVLREKREFESGLELKDDRLEDGVGPCHGMARRTTDKIPVGTRHGASQPGVPLPRGVALSASQFGKPVAGSVAVIINHYKGSVKRWCNKNGHQNFQWQSRFYDHIIRNEKAYHNIVNYIINNPTKWERDRFRPEGE